jgi:two-component system OmpR family sensor kinase
MTLLSLGVLTIASVLIYVAVSRALRSGLDRALLGIARAEISSAIDDPVRGLHVHDETPFALVLSGGEAYEKLAQIADAEGTVLAQTVNITSGAPLPIDAALAARALAGEALFTDVARGGAWYRVVYLPLQKRGRLFVMVAVPKLHVHRALEVLFVTVVVCLLCGGAASAAGANRLARRLTRPLERVGQAAGSIGEENLGARIPIFSSDVELLRVTDRLNEMLARLQDAFEAQRRLVADASHELRSPLSNLRGTTEVALRRDRSSEQYRETLTDSLAEIERLTRLVDGLLTLSRADAGQLALRCEPFDLACLARRSVEAHAARGRARDVSFAVDAAQTLIVDGDADRMRQVVDNLVDNALRHAPAGSRVRVTVGREQGLARLTVGDDGPGLTAEQRAHLFERFFRADSARARHSGGCGLGLAIAKAIVDAHGGAITVDSRSGAGGTFTVSLPPRRRDEFRGQDSPPPGKPQASEASAPPCDRLFIPVVDGGSPARL